MIGAVTTVVVVLTVVVCLVIGPARCQSDPVDTKFLDPNDYFLAGGVQPDRRRIQDAFNRCVRISVIFKQQVKSK